jgi:hypothetical protein
MDNNILNPVPEEKLIRELTPDKLLRITSKGDNEIYSFTMRQAPDTIYEIAC